MRRSMFVLALAVAVIGTLVLVPFSAASPSSAQACNLRGSWVANTAVTNQYFQALNPTTGDIHVTSGALSATFARGRFSLGSIGLHLVGTKGQTTIKEEIDLQSEAPYTVRGTSIVLGRGTYKLVYINVVLTTHGKSKQVNLPTHALSTPGHSLSYSCTPNVLQLHVPVGARTVTLTMRRDRG